MVLRVILVRHLLNRQNNFSKNCFNLLFSAVLITGGWTNTNKTGFSINPQRSAEIYLPSVGTSCSLPELPERRYFHTQDGPLACGGGSGIIKATTCVTWSQGAWTRSHNFSVGRSGHASWDTATGVYLMGGWRNMSETTSVLVKEDGTVEEGFPLKYKTKYLRHKIHLSSPVPKPLVPKPPRPNPNQVPIRTKTKGDWG